MTPHRSVIAGLATGAAVIATGVLLVTTGSKAATAAQRTQVSTATVQRQELSATVSVNGTLTYAARPDGDPYSVINEASGAYTKLPAIGQVVRQGQVLYRVNEAPVVLLYGQIPAYRTLVAGATGPDVKQLNADLVRLGYATAAELNPTSSTFGSATTAALQKLQKTVGLTESGTLTLGQAVFEPSALRVTALSTLLGASAQAGQTVAQGTSTRREVQVALDAAQQTDVTVADKVSITLPNNKTTPGVVTSVGTVATCASSSSASGPTADSTTSGTDSCSSDNSSSSTPTINVTVTPSDPASTGTWDQAPVQIGITTARVPDALTVPVNSLLARSQGGYAIEVLDGNGRTRLVAVSLGLFDDADGVVQVTDSKLVAGQRIVVPST